LSSALLVPRSPCGLGSSLAFRVFPKTPCVDSFARMTRSSRAVTLSFRVSAYPTRPSVPITSPLGEGGCSRMRAKKPLSTRPNERPSASHGVLFPSAYAARGVRCTRVYLTRHVPLSRFRTSSAASSSPRLPGLFHPGTLLGFPLQSFSPSEELYASRRLSPPAVLPRPLSMARCASAL